LFANGLATVATYARFAKAYLPSQSMKIGSSLVGVVLMIIRHSLGVLSVVGGVFFLNHRYETKGSKRYFAGDQSSHAGQPRPGYVD
jgi:hypothetical protein